MLLAAAAGCYKHTYSIGAGASDGRLVYDRWHHHWLFGLVNPEQAVELRQLCPSGNARIHSEASFLNGLVGALTTGIYSPTTVRVHCADTPARLDVELSAGDVARIVAAPGFLSRVQEVAPDRLAAARRAQRALFAD